jgi:hypothetical protein
MTQTARWTAPTGSNWTAIRASALGAALLGVAVLAGCGGSSDSDGSTSSGSGAQTAYQQCLAKNGVTLPSNNARQGGRARPSGTARPVGGQPPSPGVRPSGTAMPSGGVRPSGTAMPSGGPQGGHGSQQAPTGVDATTWAAAQKACSSLRPTGQPGNGSGPQN